MIKLNPENMIRIWKNKGQILEGIVNKVFKSEHVEEIAAERFALCESNACGMFDADGSSERAVAKGKPSCAGCGCALEYKTRCLSCHCHLQDIGQHPLWVAVVSPAEEQLMMERMKQDETQGDSANQG